MINADMRSYDYYTFGEKNEYGQPELSPEVRGSILMSIYTTSTSVQDNINYKNAQYIGLTHANINDKYVIQYGNNKLKVLYVIDAGPRLFKQVFMGDM